MSFTKLAENKLSCLVNSIKKETWRVSFYSVFIIGLFTHLYKFSNMLLNHDSVYNFYTDQNVIGSGRWFLSVACGFSSYFDLPWITGAISLFYMALTMIIIVELFDIKSKKVIIIGSGLMVTFPGITETFFFGFTADGYMLAMLFSVLAVYFSRIDEKRVYMKILSAVLLCLSCAIYQSYISLYLSLVVSYFIYQILQKEYTFELQIRYIVQQILIFILSLASYYIIWKILLSIQNVAVNNYQGINEIGTMSISLIVNGIIQTVKNYFFFFLEWNIFEHPINLYGILNIIFLISTVIVILGSLKKSKLNFDLKEILILIFSFVVWFFSVSIWCFVSSGVQYRPMMLVSILVLYIFILLLADRFLQNISKLLIMFLLSVIVFNNAVIANISYFYMEKMNMQTYATGIEMIAEIHDYQSKYNIKKIAFIGNKNNSLGSVENFSENKIHMLVQQLENDLIFNHEHAYLYLKNVLNLDLKSVTNDEIKKLSKDSQILKMGNWPDEKSVAIVDDILVIKLSDNMEEE